MTSWTRGSAFSRHHGRTGRLFQNRYHSVLCEQDANVLQLVRDVHLNPLRAKVVHNLVTYRWGSHGAYLRRRLPA